MYAVILSGGKQYPVKEGECLQVEKIDVEPGKTVEFENVLMMVDGENTQIGSPFLKGVKVKAEVIEHGRGDKVRIIKFRRRKHHMKRQGHRQSFTKIKITEIQAA